MGASPEPPPPTIGDNLLRLLESKVGADVTFQVEQAEFAVHTLVLAARSPVFRAIVQHPRPQHHEDAAVRRLVRIDDTGAPPLRLRRRAAPNGRQRLGGDAEVGRAARRGEQVRLGSDAASLRERAARGRRRRRDRVGRHRSAELKAFCVEYIVRPEVLRQVVQTEGYAELKASHPTVVAEILEQVAARLDEEEEEEDWDD